MLQTTDLERLRNKEGSVGEHGCPWEGETDFTGGLRAGIRGGRWRARVIGEVAGTWAEIWKP